MGSHESTQLLSPAQLAGECLLMRALIISMMLELHKCCACYITTGSHACKPYSETEMEAMA